MRRARAESSPGSASPAASSRRGGNSSFEPLLNPKNETTTWMEGCLVKIDAAGAIVAAMGTTSAGQGHETLLSTVVGEILERDPDTVRVVRADLLWALPSNSPVGSRMAIMLGAAGANAARKLKAQLLAIAAQESRRCGGRFASIAAATLSLAADPAR